MQKIAFICTLFSENSNLHTHNTLYGKQLAIQQNQCEFQLSNLEAVWHSGKRAVCSAFLVQKLRNVVTVL